MIKVFIEKEVLMERLPIGIISPKAKQLEDFLNSRVKGQQRAVRYLREHLEIHWAKMRDPKRPIANLLFVGPSGVGKTELAKALAEYFFGKPNRLTIINCSEFSEGHEVSTLKGAPPGYVGHGRSSALLTQWNIDRHHLENLCETGEFFKDLVAEKESKLDWFEEIVEATKKEISDLEQRILKTQMEIQKAGQSFDMIEARLKAGKDIEQRDRELKIELQKSIEEATDEIKRWQEEVKDKQKFLKYAEDEMRQFENRLNGWRKMKSVSPERRVRELYNLIESGDYKHGAGKYQSIILWDEIEKADSKLDNLLLPIMDEARLVLQDPQGTETFFHNTINIFTSNLGSDKIAEELSALSQDNGNARIGFGFGKRKLNQKDVTDLDKRIDDTARDEVRRFFSPEFYNRISKLVVFRPLDEEAMHEILDLRVGEQNLRQGIKLELEPEVKKFLVAEAMQHWSEGARLMTRRIEQFIITEIAPLKNAGKLNNGDTVLVKLGKDNKLEFYKK